MPTPRPVIAAVLSQHLEEAAFCWLRRQDGLWNPAFRREHLARTDYLLDAHLEGLRIAADAAVAPALANLDRWKSADEAFVSTYVLAHAPDEQALGRLEAHLTADAGLLGGAAAALLWSAPENALPLLQRWWSSRQPALRRAAVPAAMRHPRVKRETVVLDGLEDADASLRARACRAAGEWRLAEHERLRPVLQDADARCRFEAACALALLGDVQAASRLGEELGLLSGSTRGRAVLAWAALAPDGSFAAQFNQLIKDEAWHRDLIRALAWRGAPEGLVQLAQWLRSPAHARLSAAAICHITGLDLDADDLWQEDPPARHEDHEHEHDDEDEADFDDEHDEDAGLLPPDVDRLSQWLQLNVSRFAAGQRYLAGQPLAHALAGNATAYSMPQHWQSALLRTRLGEAGALCDMVQPRW